MDPNSKDGSGYTPLICVALYGEMSSLRFLLDRGARVDCRVNEGQTALMLAARRGHLGVTKLLVTRGHADANARDNAGRTALFYAIEWPCHKGTSAQAEQIEVLQFLLSCEGVCAGTLDHAGKSASSLPRREEFSWAERVLNLAMEKETSQ
jgi:hypothetical protein